MDKGLYLIFAKWFCFVHSIALFEIKKRNKCTSLKRIVRSDPEELKVQNVEIVSKLNTLMIEKLPI